MDGFLATLGKKEATRSGARSAGPRQSARSSSRTRRTRWPTWRPHRPPPEALGANGLFPPTAASPEPGAVPPAVRAVRRGRAARLSFLTVGGRRIAVGIHQTADGVLYYNAGSIRRARPVARGPDGLRLRGPCVGRGAAQGLPARRRGPSTSGGTDEPIQRLPDEGSDMSAPGPFDPASSPLERPSCAAAAIRSSRTASDRDERGRPGASLLARDAHGPRPVTPRSWRFPPGSAVRKLQRAGFEVLCHDEPDDAIAVGALRRTCPRSARTSSTTTCTAPRRWGREPRWPSPRSGIAGRYRLDRPLEPCALGRGPPTSPRLDAAHGPAHAVSRAIEHKLVDEERIQTPVRLIYNGVDLSRHDHQEPPARCPRSTGWNLARSSSASSPGSSPRRATRRPRGLAGGSPRSSSHFLDRR